MFETQKSLLVRADFLLAPPLQGTRRAFKRWRRILIEALPRLLGCEHRAPQAEKVRLRVVGDEEVFTGWLRIPIQRRPSRTRLRRFKRRLRDRLEMNLLPIGGQVVKVGVRRCRRVVEQPAPVLQAAG